MVALPNTAKMTGSVPVIRSEFPAETVSPCIGKTTTWIPPVVVAVKGVGIGCSHQFPKLLVVVSNVETPQLNAIAPLGVPTADGVKLLG